MKAFNAHDVEAMAAEVHDEIEWMSINGDALSAEVRGVAALRVGMQAYFDGLPSARSEIERLETIGSRVVVIERAFWKTGDGERSQPSMAVYEFDEGLIRRVYYFPVGS